ncbi:uncharacterized protein LOC124167844 isoform X2 [Ischnura elegans]|uniref:uncharacterized protein LOC124167844 isoform X2 n=1 Tax=Ischnura elegans TaxID=197161 RepID=UPI001ED88E10|nr:uncharacterized protein LOC124167844 isoform X2 [Ischnura elegans]
MAGPDEKSATEDEKSKIMYSVTKMRQLFPKKCSQFMSKQLKMKHYMLETTDIILDASENESDDSEDSNESNGDSVMDSDASAEPVDSSSSLTRCSVLSQEMDNIMAVLQQVKAEKDLEIIKICSEGLSSSNKSLEEEKT